MSDKTMKVRACDQCGSERAYEADKCDPYYNRFGKKCLAAPKDDMIIVSIPSADGRKFLDFCSMKCLREYCVEGASTIEREGV